EDEKAADDVNKAVQKFQEALKKWEELLKQLRQEEIERILTALKAQCEKMLRLQQQVLTGTIDVENAFKEKGSARSQARAEVQKSLELSDDEQTIADLATRA